MFENLLWLAVGIALLAILGVVALFAISLRRVVPTNEVHVVQTAKQTTMYGKGYEGNAYYFWPKWIPKLGMTRIVLPLTVFDLDLSSYDAYDKERVPFLVDVKAFFRISDPSMAAERIESFHELHTQLTAVVQGAVRTTLANHEIDEIMIDRSKFGEYFTKEVEENVKSWGVDTVKHIELMDVRDARDSEVIANIMAKRTSAIERDSRVTVAENKRMAETAEIEAQREIELRQQEAAQQVGQRTAEKDRAVGIANEQARQEITTQERETAVREAEVQQVRDVRAAEIAKNVNVVKAQEAREVAIVRAEGQKQETITIAEGQLEETRRKAEGITVEGAAKAEAERLMQLAPIAPQIELAKEIGSNEGYQTYLIKIEEVKALKEIGVEQAAALQHAEIKVISNVGNPSDGLTSVRELFTSKGGQAIGALFEGLKQTEAGNKLVEKVTS